MRDYQVRIEDESNGDETVHTFTSLPAARAYFNQYCQERREEGVFDDIHVELIEVLEQNCVKAVRA